MILFLICIYAYSAEEDDVLDHVDLRALENMKTSLYAQGTGPFYMYTLIPWKLHIRKEVSHSHIALTDTYSE